MIPQSFGRLIFTIDIMKRTCVHSMIIGPATCLSSAETHGGVIIMGIIDFPGSSVVQARGINNLGRIVGYQTIAGVTEGFIRTGADDQFFRIDDSNTFAVGINDAGATVGGVNTPVGSDSVVRLMNKSFPRYQPGGNTDSSAIGINNEGLIVGSTNLTRQAFIRTLDGSTTLFSYSDPNGHLTLLTAGTDALGDGTAVGYSLLADAAFNLSARGFLTADGTTFTGIAAPGYAFTFAWGGNDRGLIVGEVSDSALLSIRTGFLLDRRTGVFSFFSVAGATWTVPTGINDAGHIVGFWRDSRGNIRGFTATVVPGPASIVLSMLGGLTRSVCRIRSGRAVRQEPN